jgi:glycerol-3-phosphate O-acyltransferase
MERELTQIYAPNPVLRALYQRFFDKIQVEESWVRQVRELASRGRVVYVLRSLNVVDFLALDYLTKRHGLPPIRFVNDLGLWILNPMGKGWLNALRPDRSLTPARELDDALSRGGSAALFLKRAPGVLEVAAGANSGRGLKEGDDLVLALLELQRRWQEPILLVPQVFVWSRFPEQRGGDPLAALLGPRAWPNSTRTILQFFYNYKHVALQLGDPLDLKVFLAESEGQADPVLVRRLIYAMLRRLERERKSITGPAEKAPERIRQEILRSPRLRTVIEDLSDERTDSYALSTKAHGMLEELQATPGHATRKFLEVVLERLFQSIYAGVDVDVSDMERLRRAAHDGTLVLLPSHKSHIDYLILSYVFNIHNLPLPMIAAGDNLNFFPIGPVLRRGGGFFIRRSFRGDRLYAAVVDAYVRRLIRDGYPIELFLEGGRSRTGKLLPPKFGLLSMVVDAALAMPERQCLFVPVSIGYERVIEADSYERELLGGEKAKEDAAGLLRSSNLLRHRYGRINLQFGQLLTLREMGAELALDAAVVTPAKRRTLVTRLGNRVMDEINRVTAITPGSLTALVLLSHEQRGIGHDELVARATRLYAVARRLGARTTPALGTPEGSLRPDALSSALEMFVAAKLVEVSRPDTATTRRAAVGRDAVYLTVDSKRLGLDTSKNAIVHFFVERALVAYAVLAGGDQPSSAQDVREHVYDLSRLFKVEFRFRADAPFDIILRDTLQSMKADGELAEDATGIRPGDGREGWTGRAWLCAYASILRNFLEGYRVAARSLAEVLERPLADKELVRRGLVTGHGLFLEGTIRRWEAVSKPILQNAYAAFVDQGFLIHRDGKYHAGPNLVGQKLDELEARVAKYLPST